MKSQVEKEIKPVQWQGGNPIEIVKALEECAKDKYKISINHSGDRLFIEIEGHSTFVLPKFHYLGYKEGHVFTLNKMIKND